MRRAVLVVLAVVAAGGLLLAALAVPVRDRVLAAWSEPAVVSATTHVRDLEPPDGWWDSPGGGACARLGSIRCLWSPEPARDAVDTLAATLRLDGIPVGGTTCSADEGNDGPSCRATADVRGVPLEVVASDTVGGGGEPRGATAVGIAWADPFERHWERVGRELGWSAEREQVTLEEVAALLPERLRAGLQCVQDDVPTGCVLVAGPPLDPTGIETLVAELTAADWRVRWTPGGPAGHDHLIAERMLDMTTGANLFVLGAGPDGLRVIVG